MLSPKPAEAKVVFTPTNQSVFMDGSLKIDLNGDGVNDFTINVAYFRTTFRPGIVNTGGFYQGYGRIGVSPAQASNEVINGSVVKFRPLAEALPQGAKIASSANFIANTQTMAYCTLPGFTKYGQWTGISNHFLGLKFVVGGETHFGWARLSVKPQVSSGGCVLKVLLTGYAYETIPDKPITTGKPPAPDTSPTGSLGHLALGAAGKSH